MTTPAVLLLSWFALTSVACAACWLPMARRRLRRLPRPLLCAAGVALVARLVPALVAVPSDAVVRYDLESYRAVADAVLHHRDVYRLVGQYPYLPLHMYVFAGAAWVAAHTPLPFTLLVKLPEILADMALTLVVGRAAVSIGRGQDAGLAAFTFALNPLSILVTGYHGQFDAVPIALVFTSWWLVSSRPCRGVTLLAGLAFGLAVADKTWPLLFGPLLLWRAAGGANRGAAPRVVGFSLCALAPSLAALGLYERQVPGGALHALAVVSSYQGVVGTWGFSKLLVLDAGGGGRAAALDRAHAIGPWVLGVGVTAAYVLATRVHRDPERLALILFAAFASAAGWGVHWLSWPVPVALVAGRRWSAAYLVTAGAYVAGVYLGFGGVLYGAVWLGGDLRPLAWSEAIGLAFWMGLTASVVAAALHLLLGSRPWSTRRRAASLTHAAVTGEVAPAASAAPPALRSPA